MHSFLLECMCLPEVLKDLVAFFSGATSLSYLDSNCLGLLFIMFENVFNVDKRHV